MRKIRIAASVFLYCVVILLFLSIFSFVQNIQLVQNTTACALGIYKPYSF